MKRYKEKAEESFKTKLDLFVFDRIVNGLKINLEEYPLFEITEEIVENYTARFWQLPREYKFANSKTIDSIYYEMKNIKKENESSIQQLEKAYVENVFPKLFPKDHFLEMVEKNNCAYCDITIEEIKQLALNKKIFNKNERGGVLEIDRINSNFEYSKTNCVMACYWCNNAKTDEFTYDEFVKIGKSIKEVWMNRSS